MGRKNSFGKKSEASGAIVIHQQFLMRSIYIRKEWNYIKKLRREGTFLIKDFIFGRLIENQKNMSWLKLHEWMSWRIKISIKIEIRKL